MFQDRKILVVEDDKNELAIIEGLLHTLKAGYSVASTLAAASDLLTAEAFDFLLTDLHIETKAGFERPDGLDVIALARQLQPNIVIVATSSDPRIDIWNDALTVGAQHFIRKPLSQADELSIAFGMARERKLLVSTVLRKPEVAGRWADFVDQYPDGIVVDKVTQAKIKGIAKHNTMACVLMGETGTGKEEMAKVIHRHRIAKEGSIPFVAVNCATITSGLAESLLFGHKKGSFTGADQTTVGYVGEADGGILFLDEIHTLDLKIQQKLLRVLEDGTYNRLGETKTYRSRFQLIAASTRDLDDEIDAGNFLLDLRSRMTGLDITVAPLRDRRGDIPALTALFLARKNLHLDDAVFHELTEKLQSYYWRGNIRQLFKVLESWILQCEFQEIPLSVAHLPIFKGMLAPGEKEAEEPVKPAPSAVHEEILRPLSEDADLTLALEAYEKMIIEGSLARHTSIAHACKSLNVPRSTLDARRRKLGIA